MWNATDASIFWIHLMQRVTLHHPQAERDGTWNDDGYHDDYDDGGNIKSKKQFQDQMVLLGLVLNNSVGNVKTY